MPIHPKPKVGRIERLFGSFQDRLVSELRLAYPVTDMRVTWESGGEGLNDW